MRCSNCQSENPDIAKFCIECASPFARRCPSCGTENPPAAKFCLECARSLEPGATPTTSNLAPASQAPDGERRHLTVLFCDLVNSTGLAAQYDPEDWRNIVAGYQHVTTEAINRFGGFVARYVGDGVMAFFGYPEAHDNDAERSVRAGLAVVDAVSKLDDHSTYPKLSVRVGIDSGAVVVGSGASKDIDVFGDTPNLASRVQSAAAPDTVLISGATHRLLSGMFLVQERGSQQLKGVSNPVELYRVLRPSGVRGRLAAARGLTPFVGREEELRLLLSRWERARDGEGQHVLVVGEAGIGKSRLVAEFHDRVRDTPHIWIESGGEQFLQNSPFHAATEMLSKWLELEAGSKADDRMDHLERALAAGEPKPAEAAPLIADLLQLPPGERYSAIALTPEQRRRRLLAALTGWVFGVARSQPVVMVVEDLHWLDPSTLELLQLLADQGVMVPLMLMCTARPEFHPQWPMRSHHTQITLNRLSVRNVREMVAQVATQNALNNQSVDAVIERTEGNPLFVEELTRAVLESGNLGARAIPVTLHDSLMARLDRLGSAKNLLQLGAVIGGEFSYELVRAVSPGSESALESELRKLTDADLLYFRGIPPDATYQFKHALIRDAAYDALLKSRRKELHGLVARTIDEKFPDIKQAHPEVLARHWTEAGELEPAIAEWSRAGRAAQTRNAFLEGLEHYSQALKLLSGLPESPGRDSHELQLRELVLTLLHASKGYAAAETIAAVNDAAALAQKTGKLAELVNVFIAKSAALYVSGDLAGASATADRALNLAVRQGDPNLAFVHAAQIWVRYSLGDLGGAEDHFRVGLRFFQGLDKSGLNIAVHAFAYGSLTAWLQGRPGVARDRQREVLALATTGSPFELANAEYYASLLEIRLRNYKKVEALSEHALQLAKQHQMSLAMRSQCQLGWARACLGETVEGVAIIQQGIASVRETGTRVGLSEALSGLVEAQALTGAVEDALETVEQALQLLPAELSYRPETLRLRGELRFRQQQTESAETDFRDSIALAHKAGAKSWELRSAMSLAQLLRDTGRSSEAGKLLSEIYNWFTEGFDTPDLKEAKTLLDELSR